jgi:DNA invertase Pin-like site-specific DNA recombinase
MKRSRKEAPRHVFYCRLSYPKKDEKGQQDFDNQISKLRSIWKDPSIVVYDEVVSGAGYRRVLLELVSTLPRESHIYTAHLDRLSRKGIYDLLLILHQAQLRKIKIWTADRPEEPIDLEKDEIRLFMLAFAAKQERLSAKRRVEDQMDAAKRRGEYWGIWKAVENGNFKFGIKPLKEEYYEGIPRLLELQRQGLPYDQIAKKFNQETGAKLSKTHCYRLIQRALNPPQPKPYPTLPVLTPVQ